jgi:hypothetical protein
MINLKKIKKIKKNKCADLGLQEKLRRRPLLVFSKAGGRRPIVIWVDA